MNDRATGLLESVMTRITDQFHYSVLILASYGPSGSVVPESCLTSGAYITLISPLL